MNSITKPTAHCLLHIGCTLCMGGPPLINATIQSIAGETTKWCTDLSSNTVTWFKVKCTRHRLLCSLFYYNGCMDIMTKDLLDPNTELTGMKLCVLEALACYYLKNFWWRWSYKHFFLSLYQQFFTTSKHLHSVCKTMLRSAHTHHQTMNGHWLKSASPVNFTCTLRS